MDFDEKKIDRKPAFDLEEFARQLGNQHHRMEEAETKRRDFEQRERRNKLRSLPLVGWIFRLALPYG